MENDYTITKQTVFSRALLGIVLSVGFYSIAIFFIIFGVLIAFAAVSRGRIQGQAAVFGLVLAGSIAYSIFPRRRVWKDPGVRLEGEQKLFEVIEEIAQKTGQEVPHDVYITEDMNAYVTSRGNFFTSRRIMAIGLPLLHTFTVDEVKAIIAHEFGHYHGGDIAVGPFIYHSRRAQHETVQNLARYTRLMYRPFLAYARMYEKVTRKVSRNQEYVADHLAATVVNKSALLSALRKLNGLSPAFASYIKYDVNPIVDAGYQPDLLKGFDQFLSLERTKKAVQQFIDVRERTPSKNPFDTHPSLYERTKALQNLPEAKISKVPAVSLLTKPAEFEKKLFNVLIDKPLKPIGWNEVIDAVYGPLWRKNTEGFEDVLRELTPAQFPDFIAEHGNLIRQFTDHSKWKTIEAQYGLKHNEKLAINQIDDEINRIVSSACILRLQDKGWRVHLVPGEFYLKKGTATLDPTNILPRLISQSLTVDDWLSECKKLKIESMPLHA